MAHVSLTFQDFNNGSTLGECFHWTHFIFKLLNKSIFEVYSEWMNDNSIHNITCISNEIMEKFFGNDIMILWRSFWCLISSKKMDIPKFYLLYKHSSFANCSRRDHFGLRLYNFLRYVWLWSKIPAFIFHSSFRESCWFKILSILMQIV